MERTLEQFRRLVDAEDFFAFFDLPYDQQVVRVNRLHILKKLSLLIEAFDRKQVGKPIEEAERLGGYRQALVQAYHDLARSSGVEQKLFKVFHRQAVSAAPLPQGGTGRSAALQEKVERVLAEVRPLLQSDGGDVELVEVIETTVMLKLQGACAGCPSSQSTLANVLEQRLKEAAPEIENVLSV
jgi:nitrogenase-stabilizing/protective protein